MACRVWFKFQVKKSDDSFVKLRIQVLPENRIDDVVELLIKHLGNEEMFHTSTGVTPGYNLIFIYLLEYYPYEMTYRVWSKFQAKKRDGSFLKLRIQDLPKNRIDDAVELFMKHFATEEIFHKATGILKNDKAVAELRTFITGTLKESAFHNLLCCEDNDGDEIGQIVGVSSTYLFVVGSKPNAEIKLEAKEIKTLFELLNGISDLYNQIEELNCSCYYNDAGLVVHPEFRVLGIATEFFKARSQVCVANNIPATVALMTSLGSQKAAERANWQSCMEVSLEKLGQQHGVVFEDLGVRKIMIWKQPPNRI